MQTWTNSQPMPRLLLWPVRSPVMRWPTLSKRPSFLMSMWISLAGLLALVADHRLGRLQVPDPAKSGRSRTRLTVAGETSVSLAICWPVQRWRRRAMICSTRLVAASAGAAVRPRGAVHQARRPLGSEPLHPLAHRLDVDAEGRGHGLRRSALNQHPPNQLGSTVRRQPGILMHVHPVPRTLKLATPASRSGPDGQPIESSQLEHDPKSLNLKDTHTR